MATKKGENQSSGTKGLISSVVDLLTQDSIQARSGWLSKPVNFSVPSRISLMALIEDIRSILFPGYFGPTDFTSETVKFHVGSLLHRIQKDLEEQVKRGLCFACLDELGICPESECRLKANNITAEFISRLPEVRRILNTDVHAAFEGDPAATRPEETIFCYPGILAVTNYRIAHELYKLQVPLIPRIITEHAHGITGIDIHPGAQIGESFFIDHGTGVVIGETTIIGNRVRLYQGVTLGAKSFPLDVDGNPIKGIPRHPIVEDDVIIYAGATILGRVTIGKGSVIGGNVWLTQDVPEGSRVSQRPGQLSGFNGKD